MPIPIFRHIRTSFFGSWPKPSNASAGSLHALIVGGHCLLGTLLDTYLLSISPLAQGTSTTKRHHTQELVKNLVLARQMTANNEGPTEKIGVLFQKENSFPFLYFVQVYPKEVHCSRTAHFLLCYHPISKVEWAWLSFLFHFITVPPKKERLFWGIQAALLLFLTCLHHC